MRKLVCAAALVATCATPALAGKDLPIREFKLDNGLKVLLLENHKAPVVTFQVWYRVGSRNETLGQTGISHFLEHVMFLGSKKYPDNSYDRLTEANGGLNNAFTSNDYTCYFIDFSSDLLELAAKLEADRMQNLLLNPAKFDSELSVVKEERRWRTENSPTGAMHEELYSLAFKNHPYRWPIVGWMDDLDKMTRSKMVDYYKSHYAPNNATVVVVGDFHSPDTLKMIKRHFGGIPRGKNLPSMEIKEAPQTSERRSTIQRDVSTPNLLMGYHAPAISSKDSFALTIADTVLFGGESSRVHLDLVENRKIAQEVSSDLDQGRDPGLYALYAAPMPGHTLAELEKAIEEHLERLKKEPISDRELKKAINNAEAAFIYGQQKNHELALTIGRFDALGDYKLINRYVEELGKVTKEDVMKAAESYFVASKRTIISLLSKEKNEAQGVKK